MELSQDILKSINLLGDTKQIPDAAFKEITELAFGVILNITNEDKLTESQVLSKIDPIPELWSGLHYGTEVILLKENFYSFSPKSPEVLTNDDRQQLVEKLDLENRFPMNHIDAYSRSLKSKFSGVYIEPGNLVPYSGEVDLKKKNNTINNNGSSNRKVATNGSTATRLKGKEQET